MSDLSTAERRAALFARSSTSSLVEALRMVAAQPSFAGFAQTRVWLIEELEARSPAAADAVQAAFDQAELDGTEVDYVETLAAALGR